MSILAATLLAACASGAAQRELVESVPPLKADVFASITADQFLSGKFVAADGTVLPYRLLAPLSPRAGETYPLVVQFHGSGGIGTDNVSQLDRLARSWAMPDVRQRYPAYVLIPQFPVRSANYGPHTPEQESAPSAALGAALELARDFATGHPVDRSRIYAVGFSMGGSAAWLAPSLAPTLLAAIVPVSGIAPGNSLASLYRDFPVLVLHGNADSENPIMADARFFNAITTSGGRRIRFREYAGLDHQPPGDIHPGFWWRDWLFAQRRR